MIDTNHKDTKNTENGFEMITWSESPSGRPPVPTRKRDGAHSVHVERVRMVNAEATSIDLQKRSFDYSSSYSNPPDNLYAEEPGAHRLHFSSLGSKRSKVHQGRSGSFTHWQFRNSDGALRRILSDGSAIDWA